MVLDCFIWKLALRAFKAVSFSCEHFQLDCSKYNVRVRNNVVSIDKVPAKKSQVQRRCRRLLLRIAFFAGIAAEVASPDSAGGEGARTPLSTTNRRFMA